MHNKIVQEQYIPDVVGGAPVYAALAYNNGNSKLAGPQSDLSSVSSIAKTLSQLVSETTLSRLELPTSTTNHYLSAV